MLNRISGAHHLFGTGKHKIGIDRTCRAFAAWRLSGSRLGPLVLRAPVFHQPAEFPGLASLSSGARIVGPRRGLNTGYL